MDFAVRVDASFTREGPGAVSTLEVAGTWNLCIYLIKIV